MWRTASSLELLPGEPNGTGRRAGQGAARQFGDSNLWCLSRLGARELFYGPINQVLRRAIATRWVEALLKVPNADDALGLPGAPHRRSHARCRARHFEPSAARLHPKLLAIFEGEESRTNRRWDAFSARRCRRGWCWRRWKTLP